MKFVFVRTQVPCPSGRGLLSLYFLHHQMHWVPLGNILPNSVQTQYSFTFVDGVAKVFKHENENMDSKEREQNDEFENKNELFEMHSFEEYIQDLQFIYKLMAFGPANTLCYKRLKILQCRFKLHLFLNNEVEATESHSIPYRDFYNGLYFYGKVSSIYLMAIFTHSSQDWQSHHSACMHQKHLLRFMKDKIVFTKVFDDLKISWTSIRNRVPFKDLINPMPNITLWDRDHCGLCFWKSTMISMASFWHKSHERWLPIRSIKSISFVSIDWVFMERRSENGTLSVIGYVIIICTPIKYVG